MSLPTKSPSTSRTPSSPTDRAVRFLQQRFAAYNRRRLTWTDAVALCEAFDVAVTVGRSRQDAVARRRAGRPEILVSDRVHLETWGAFCLPHELAHHLLHPGPREFYLGSPGWHSHCEAQANLIGLLALWPHVGGHPYPRILQIDGADPALVALHIAVTSGGGGDYAARWTSRRLTLQRYK